MKRLLMLALLLAFLTGGCALPENAGSAEISETIAGASAPAQEEQTLTVCFLDVGQADCALLMCGGESMLIDGGNVDDGQYVVAYLERQDVEELTYVLCTHAHEDHVGGLAAALAAFPAEHVLSPTTESELVCFQNFLRYAEKQGLSAEVPACGDSFALGGALVTILGPVQDYPDTNNTSLVTLVTFGETRFLFTGDMEREAENDMLDYWGDTVAWDVDVLKVGHHGSATSTGYRFLYETMPEYAVISCGADNAYGHPHEETVSRLHDAGTEMLRTDELGAITAVSDGSEITFTWENGSAKPTAAGERAAERYIANTRSGIFHAPDCDGLPAESNRAYFDSYDEALAAGYTPCGSCLGQ